MFENLANLPIQIVGVLFVFTVVVFIHELGHFLVARWCGVRIKAFSIGFGPEIFGFNDRHGTRWRFAWIPLGGYVKFIDDDNAASVPDREQIKEMSDEERAGTFQGKTVAQRSAIVAAGPIANFLLAIAIFAVMAATIGERSISARVDEVLPDSAAAEAGMKSGDLIISIDGAAIESFADMQIIVSGSSDIELMFVLERDGGRLQVKATPKRRETTDRFGNTFKIGMLGIRRSSKPEDWIVKQYDPISAVVRGTERTWMIITRSLGYIADIIAGKEDAEQLGGPIQIAKIAGQAASVGIVFLLNIAALISVSLGLINLFPIPILDGGHLLFYAIEAIRGQPLGEKAQEIGFRIGLALILMLMVFATFNDLRKLWS